MFDTDAPDWLEHPVYSALLSNSERLQLLRDRRPSSRPTTEIAQLDLASLSTAERADLLELLEEQRNWLESMQLRVLADLQRTDTTKLGLSQEQTSATLRLPLRTAQRKLATARTVVRQLPRTLELMTEGRLTGRHAQVIVEATETLPAELADDLEARVLDRAPWQTVPQLKQAVRRAAIALDPATAEQRHQKALADREVRFEPLPDGMANLSVLLRAADGQLLYTRLTAATQLLPATDPRTIGQQRADLLVDAVLSRLSPDSLPTVHGRKPSVQVIVSADTLLGLDDQPGDLAGYGAITAETARRLAADTSGSWRRLLTDPDTGELLDIGERSYRPSQRLRDFITARDGVCTFPTCNQPGYRCEYEHIVSYLNGGRTCRCNGALACRRHNLCKVDTGWEYRRNVDGSFTWTDDSGRDYRSYPPQRWARPADRSSPRPAPTADLAQIHQAEDTAYGSLRASYAADLARAYRAADRSQISHVQRAIRAASAQRVRQLAHRANPDQPPF